MFNSIIESATASLSFETAIICTGVSLVLGLIIALVYMTQGNYSKNFLITLVLLPALVQVVIMLVNGNLGTSVAVMGAFSLVRFRSLPGTSKEIIGIFFAMVVGLATGMGYVSYAVVFTIVLALVLLLLEKTKFGDRDGGEKSLKITIPESLDYSQVFEDLFEEFTTSHVLNTVKTTNMGSLYELQYLIHLKTDKSEKEFIDELRCRNGNLTILCGRKVSNPAEL